MCAITVKLLVETLIKHKLSKAYVP